MTISKRYVIDHNKVWEKGKTSVRKAKTPVIYESKLPCFRVPFSLTAKRGESGCTTAF
jgi:hypothetical protein